jgi:hypothetical protein
VSGYRPLHQSVPAASIAARMSSIGTGPVDQTPSKDSASTEVEALSLCAGDVGPSVRVEESHDADPINTNTMSATGPMAPCIGPDILTSSIKDPARVAVEPGRGNARGRRPGSGARGKVLPPHTRWGVAWPCYPDIRRISTWLATGWRR